MGEVLVSESEIVDIGGVSSTENLLASIVEAVRMRDRHVEKEKIDGGIGEKGVACDSEAGVVAGVLADIAALAGGRARAMAE